MQALDVFLAHPRNKEIAHYSLSDAEWEALRDFEAVLAVRTSFSTAKCEASAHDRQIPFTFQQRLSSQRTPVLADTLPAIERLMTAWEGLVAHRPHLSRFINAGLAKLREGYDKMDCTRAYVITLGPFIAVSFPHQVTNGTFCLAALNPTVKFTHIQRHWDESYVTQAHAWVQDEVSYIPTSFPLDVSPSY